MVCTNGVKWEDMRAAGIEAHIVRTCKELHKFSVDL